MQVQPNRPATLTCPHGAAPSACPLCSNGGGGGGGGGGSVSRRAGLMNWSEAFATWNAIQVAQNRQKAYLKGVTDSISLRNQDANRQPAIMQSLPPMVQRFAQNLANFFQLAASVLGIKGGTQDAKAAPADSKNPFQATAAQTEAGLKLVTSRLSNILGEMRTLTEEQTKAAIEWVKNLIIEKQWQQKLVLILSESWELLSQFNPSQKLKSAFQSLLSWLGLSQDKEALSDTPKDIY